MSGLKVRMMMSTAVSLKLPGLQVSWDLDKMQTFICKPGVGLRIRFSDKLPGHRDADSSWIPH